MTMNNEGATSDELDADRLRALAEKIRALAVDYADVPFGRRLRGFADELERMSREP
jgi:hypothetical protein